MILSPFALAISGVFVAGVSIVTGMGFPMAAAAQAPAPLTITSPVSGAIVTSGQSITVTVTVASGTYPYGVGLFTKDPLGGADLQPVVGSTVNLIISIPAYTTPGPYPIFAVGSNAAGAEVDSSTITIMVERADMPTALAVSPSGILFEYVGETLPWTIWGTFAGGLKIDVSQSSHLTVASENPSVATVQNGIVSAAGSGKTNIDVTYGSITVKVPITVPASIRGDLNGDGIVDKSDVTSLWRLSTRRRMA